MNTVQKSFAVVAVVGALLILAVMLFGRGVSAQNLSVGGCSELVWDNQGGAGETRLMMLRRVNYPNASRMDCVYRVVTLTPSPVRTYPALPTVTPKPGL